MGFPRSRAWIRASRHAPGLLLAASLMWGLVAAPAARAVVLQDGAWEAEIDLTSQAGLERWEDPLGVDHAGQVWYWLSVGPTDPTSVAGVGPLTTTLTDTNADGNKDSLNAFYDGFLFDITLNQRLSDGGVLGDANGDPFFSSVLSSVLKIENTSAATISDLHVWVYADMELLGTATDDVLGPFDDVAGPGGPIVDFRVLQLDRVLGSPTVYEGDVEPAILRELANDSLQVFSDDDGFLSFLNNAANEPGGQEGTVTNGDLSALVSLSFDLAPGESIQLVHTQSLLTPVPEPGTALLLGLGLLGLLAGGRRRSS